MFTEVKEEQFGRVDNAELMLVVVDNPGDVRLVL